MKPKRSPSKVATTTTKSRAGGATGTGPKTRSAKRPLDPREYPAARDSRGSPSRAEIRQEAPRIVAPRVSNKPVERSNQPRSHKTAGQQGGIAGR